MYNLQYIALVVVFGNAFCHRHSKQIDVNVFVKHNTIYSQRKKLTI